MWLAALVPALVLVGYAAAIGLEFLWLARHHGEPTRPPLRRLAKAWAIEVSHGPRVFGWLQPFRQRAIADALDDAPSATRGVVLVHGFFCNRAIWSGWMRRLRAARVPCVAIDLDPVFAPIGSHADTIDAAVRRVTEASGGLPPVVAAHSMGGLATRAWLARDPVANAARVHRVVTIGTPHRGTWLARFARVANGREMRMGSDCLRALDAEEPPAVRERFVCFWSDCDNIVFPSANATLAGADNRGVSGWAHVHLIEHPAVFAAVLEAVREPPAQMS